MAYVHQLLGQPSQWQISQQAGPGSVPKFTSTSITVKQLLIKNKNINQSKSSLLIWHYVSYLFLLRFLPYIGMAAILVMWPGPFEQTFVPLSQGDSIWNLTLIGQAVSEEKMFKSVDDRRQTTDDGRTTEAYLSFKLTFGSRELRKREIRKKQEILLIVLSKNALSFRHLCTRSLIFTVTVHAALEIGSIVPAVCIFKC